MSNSFGKDDKSNQNKMVDADLIAGKVKMASGDEAIAIGFKGSKKALVDGISKLDDNDYAHLILLTPDDARSYAEYIIQLADQMSVNDEEKEDGEIDDEGSFMAG